MYVDKHYGSAGVGSSGGKSRKVFSVDFGRVGEFPCLGESSSLGPFCTFSQSARLNLRELESETRLLL